MTWRDMTGQDVTWRDMTWRDMTWHEVHHVAWWHDVTWHDVTWRDIMRHDATWRDMMRCDVTQHDLTWRVIRISTQQEWTSTACEMAEILSKNYWNLFRFEDFYRRFLISAPASIKPKSVKNTDFCHPIGQMDLSCPWTVQDEIFHKCRETIALVQVCFRFELIFYRFEVIVENRSQPVKFWPNFRCF